MQAAVGARNNSDECGRGAYGAQVLPPGFPGQQLMQAAAMGMHTQVLAHLGILLEMASRQTEEHMAMKKSLEEQVARGKGYQQSIDSLRNQVVDLQEQSSAVAAGLALGGMSVNSQARMGGRTNTMSDHPKHLDERLMETRRGRLRSHLSPADSTIHSDKSGTTPITLSIASALPAPGVLSLTETDLACEKNGFALSEPTVVMAPTSPESSVSGATWVGAEPHEHDVGFNRSPPGLECPWSRTSSPEALKHSVAHQFKALIETMSSPDVHSFVSAIKRADALSINSCDIDGMTVLHYAAMDGRIDICNEVLRHPAFVEVRKGDRNGATALHIAALHDHSDVASEIIAADQSLLSSINRFGDTAHDIAVRRADPSVCAVFAKAYECR